MVSVLIPAYNAEKTINRCLDSILCQTFQDIELIIVNDGSTDNTLSILLIMLRRISGYNLQSAKSRCFCC